MERIYPKKSAYTYHTPKMTGPYTQKEETHAETNSPIDGYEGIKIKATGETVYVIRAASCGGLSIAMKEKKNFFPWGHILKSVLPMPASVDDELLIPVDPHRTGKATTAKTPIIFPANDVVEGAPVGAIPLRSENPVEVAMVRGGLA